VGHRQHPAAFVEKDERGRKHHAAGHDKKEKNVTAALATRHEENPTGDQRGHQRQNYPPHCSPLWPEQWDIPTNQEKSWNASDVRSNSVPKSANEDRGTRPYRAQRLVPQN